MRLQVWNLALADRTKNRNCALANASGSVSLLEKKGIFQNNFLHRRSFRINSTEFSAAKTPTADITTPIVVRNEFVSMTICIDWCNLSNPNNIELTKALVCLGSGISTSTFGRFSGQNKYMGHGPAMPKGCLRPWQFWPKLLLFSNVTRLAVKFPADNLKSSRIRRR